MLHYIKKNKGKISASVGIASVTATLVFNAGWIVVAGFWVGVFVLCMYVAHTFLSESESGDIG